MVLHKELLPVIFLNTIKRILRKNIENKSKTRMISSRMGQGYIFTGVCDSVHRGEYLGRYPPPGTPPGPGTPPRTRYTPQTRYTPL